jgi:hypothetical protein
MLEIHDNHGTRTSKVAERDGDHDLPCLESTLQKPTGDVIEFEWKLCYQYSDLIDLYGFYNRKKSNIGETNCKKIVKKT